MAKKIRTAINALTIILLIYLAYLLTSGCSNTTDTNTIYDNDSTIEQIVDSMQVDSIKADSIK